MSLMLLVAACSLPAAFAQEPATYFEEIAAEAGVVFSHENGATPEKYRRRLWVRAR